MSSFQFFVFSLVAGIIIGAGTSLQSELFPLLRPALIAIGASSLGATFAIVAIQQYAKKPEPQLSDVPAQ